MYNKKIIKNLVPITMFGFLLFNGLVSSGDEPTSEVTPSGDQNAAFDDSSGNITLSTSTIPTPQCTGDSPVGSPTFYWDYGPDLDAIDNMDYSSTHAETLTIKTDQEGLYHVTVYCTQLFTPQGASGSTTYPESTLPSQ